MLLSFSERFNKSISGDVSVRKLVSLVVGLVVLLAGCNDLTAGPVNLEAQRMSECTFQGAVWKGSTIYTDISASCRMVLDGYNDLETTTSIQRSTSRTGPYSNVGSRDFVYPFDVYGQGYYINIDHAKATASACNGTYWFRGRIAIRSIDAARNVGNTTSFITPEKQLSCP